MAWPSVWGIGACVLSGMAAANMGYYAACQIERQAMKASIFQNGFKAKGMASSTLTQGIGPLLPMSRRLLEHKAISSNIAALRELLGERKVASKDVGLLSALIAALVVAACICAMISGSLVFGLAVSGLLLVCLFALSKKAISKRSARIRQGIPNAINAMTTCFRAGSSMEQTLGYLKDNSNGMLAAQFASAYEKVKLGQSVSVAMDAMSRSTSAPGLSFVSIALDIQHQCGGDITPVLASARESVEDELDLERELKVQTSQARLSATIVTLMPFILLAIFSFMSPSFLDPFFSSWAGTALLAVAIVMEVAGVSIVLRMLKVDVS